MRSAHLELEPDREDGQHDTDESQNAGENGTDQIDRVVSPRVGDHVSLDGNGLDTVHDHVVRQTFLAQHFSLESSGDEVCHCQELFVCGVAADRISVGDIEIHLRTLESHQALVEVLGNDKDTVYLTLLHCLACLGIRVGQQLYVHGGRSLHLVAQTARDRGLVEIDYRHRHFLRRAFFHQREEEEGGKEHHSCRGEEV